MQERPDFLAPVPVPLLAAPLLAAPARYPCSLPLLAVRRYHFYAEARYSFTDNVHVLCRYTRTEDTHGRIASVAVWKRALSDREIDDLARGGLGPSGQGSDGGALLASYTADDATERWMRNIGPVARGDAAITGGRATFSPLLGGGITRP